MVGSLVEKKKFFRFRQYRNGNIIICFIVIYVDQFVIYKQQNEMELNLQIFKICSGCKSLNTSYEFMGQ